MRPTRAALVLIVRHRAFILTRLLPLYAAGAALVYLGFAYIDGFAPRIAEDNTFVGSFGTVFLGMIAIYALAAVGQAFLAVLWHREALEPEDAGFGAAVLLRYLGIVILLVLILVLAVWLPFLILVAVLNYFAFSEGVYGSVLIAVGAPAYLVANWIWMRVGLSLPAAAIGDREMTLGASLALTRPYARGLWPAAAVTLVLILASEFAGYVSFAAMLIVWPLAPLFGVAVLSALYRQAAEDAREGTSAEGG